ncbi:MAG: GntR family transcriptional regulator [Candidatus Eremiobacteraeota bacterium]|nr:GntR family transcriptional regulator [Candidatus Eremiobacteraeota bacterium]MBV8723132.1 GntR family transcriptional regulator [Candidatus Eremiobacteraeota bacterium]
MQISQLAIDDISPVPVYAQLTEQLLAAVARGAIRRGEQLPSVRDVAAALGINPNTVNRAYVELEREGVLETRRGRGTFVASAPARTPALARLTEIAKGFVARARALGYDRSQILGAVRKEIR